MMIAKCKNCNFVRITRQRKSCPHCNAKLSRPSVDELRNLGESMMDRMRAVVCMNRRMNTTKAMDLAGFMAVFHGQHLTQHQAERMLRD